jgi:hypothetical protein
MTKSAQILILKKALFLVKSVNKKLDELNDKHYRANNNYKKVA